jgi:hypothetical protein
LTQLHQVLNFKTSRVEVPCFDTAAITISGIELAAKIRKHQHQFKVGKLPGRPATIPKIWATVIAA